MFKGNIESLYDTFDKKKYKTLSNILMAEHFSRVFFI